MSQTFLIMGFSSRGTRAYFAIFFLSWLLGPASNGLGLKPGSPPCSTNPVPYGGTTLGRNHLNTGPRYGSQPSSIFKRHMAETRFFTGLAFWHEARSIFKRPLAETDFFADPDYVGSSNDPWPKPIFLRARLCGIHPAPYSNDPWTHGPIFLPARLVASTQFHPQTTIGLNTPIFCWPALWHGTHAIFKRPYGGNRFFCEARLCGINPAPIL